MTARARSTLVLGALLATAVAPLPSSTDPLAITVDTSRTRYAMRGGIGASWHAMSLDVPLDNEKFDYPVRMVNPRGSGWGGNPPLSNAAAWRQLGEHASFLGLDFVRVELSQRMYEPERRRFDWDNDEMQALYRILDWAEAAKADVLLQQMWGHVEWNAFPGVHPLLSAPRSLDEFAFGIGELAEHLTKRKGYTCIRWLAIVNEPPGGTWGYWWSTGSHPSFTITPALAAVRAELDRRGLALSLSAPDWTSLPPFDAAKIDFDAHVGAYDIHSYERLTPEGQKTLAAWAEWAHAHGKPFFLSEMGDMGLGWGGTNPGPKGFDAALSNAEKVLRGLAAGVDGFNRWSFTNRGDLDGQWQLVRTFDTDRKQHLDTVTPEPVAYAGYAMLTRFAAKHSDVLDLQVSAPAASVAAPGTTVAPAGDDAGDLFAAALRSPSGKLTIIAANLASTERQVTLKVLGLQRAATLARYQLTALNAEALATRFAPDTQVGATAHGAAQTLPPRSLTVWTSHGLAPTAPGAIVE
jgi:hypothetical protein